MEPVAICCILKQSKKLEFEQCESSENYRSFAISSGYMRWIVPLVCWCCFLAAKPLQVEIAANSAILVNADSGAVLFGKQPFTPLYPASTTKIATALFVLDAKRPPLDQVFKVSAESLHKKPLQAQAPFPAYWWDSDGTRAGLCAGETLSLDTLLHGLMMMSGNDAANVIAEGISGSIPAFMEEMNQYLRRIGCTATRFCNPHGCHHPDHATSAYDLSVMTQKALAIPKFRQLVSQISYMKPKTNKQGALEWKQRNRLLVPGSFYYAKAIGVKRGFHSAAQHTFVAAAAHEGRTLIAVLMGLAKPDDCYVEAIRLFEAAFAETKETRRFFRKGHLFSRHVTGAKTPLSAHLTEDLSLSCYPSEEPACRAFVHWEHFVLPIRKGQVVGEVRVVNDKGEILKRGALAAKSEVKGTLFFVLKEMFSALFR